MINFLLGAIIGLAAFFLTFGIIRDDAKGVAACLALCLVGVVLIAVVHVRVV